jgi:hypothetical protein
MCRHKRILRSTFNRARRHPVVEVARAQANEPIPVGSRHEPLPLNAANLLDAWSAIEDLWRRCAVLGTVHRTRGDALQFILTISVDELNASAFSQWAELGPVLLQPATYTVLACGQRFELVQHIEQLKSVPAHVRRHPPITWRITLAPLSRLRQWPEGEALVAAIRGWAEPRP